MFLVRMVVNAVILVGELAAIAGLAWLGFHYPYVFAGATAVAALCIGAALERARLTVELPFFFAKVGWLRLAVYGVVAVAEASVKALLAGLVALLTFSGTDETRRMWVAVVLGVTVWLGTSVLRRLAMSFDAKAARWGYFRLAVPLGLVFTAGIAVLGVYGLVKTPSAWEVMGQLVDVPRRPTLPQISELLFKLKLFFDGLVEALLGTFLPAHVARVLAVVVSVNTLTGFIAALYAVMIAAVVLWLEERAPG